MALISKLLSGAASLATKAIVTPLKGAGNSIWSGLKNTKSSINDSRLLRESLRTKNIGPVDSPLVKEINKSFGISNAGDSGINFTAAFNQTSLGKRAGSAVKWGNRMSVKFGKSKIGGDLKTVGRGIKFGAGKAWEFTPVGPIAVGVGLFGGAAYGATAASIQRSNARTQRFSGRGMAANNLGTDGLTLALSHRRHR